MPHSERAGSCCSEGCVGWVYRFSPGASTVPVFTRRLQQGIIHLPRPPPPPFDIHTMEPIEPPWQAIKEWIPDDASKVNPHTVQALP